PGRGKRDGRERESTGKTRVSGCLAEAERPQSLVLSDPPEPPPATGSSPIRSTGVPASGPASAGGLLVSASPTVSSLHFRSLRFRRGLMPLISLVLLGFCRWPDDDCDLDPRESIDWLVG
ncbi:Os05g0437800, partial [Oryza sativa Japonica Group]